ncbi:MAG: hypothetical protein LBE92_03855 [Chryseobacterium sp.]|uniref:bacteriocin-like protein n=1 Tax=Chryseobacterium sp. TaxID=1871047 RepID=UPI0028346A36|nr:hypothetical protein [Chryseobacterium sp.]MDR2235236.1 hypothetical protein [Chryseobacterium sp.]
MKNLKKLAKSELKKINGGSAPKCSNGEIPCFHEAQGSTPHYWTCEPVTIGCRL